MNIRPSIITKDSLNSSAKANSVPSGKVPSNLAALLAQKLKRRTDITRPRQFARSRFPKSGKGI